MTSPRSTYGGGYHPGPGFADTPIYDMLVAERGTPQIAPIRVPTGWDSGPRLPALPAALPALPSGGGASQHHGYGQPPRPAPSYGYPPAQQPAPLQQAPAARVPQQGAGGYGYPAAPQPPQAHQPSYPAQQPYQAPQMRPVAPPQQVSHAWDDPYGRSYQGQGGGY